MKTISERLKYAADRAPNYSGLMIEAAKKIDELEAILTKQAKAEPVAYRHETADGLSCVNTLPPSGQIGWKTTPLYEHPPGAKPG